MTIGVSTKTKSSKVYISIGKITTKNDKGQNKTEEKFICLAENLAILVGATYTKTSPQPKVVRITKGKLAGRSYTKEVPITLTRVRYRLGYVTGTRQVKEGNKTRKEAVITWVPLNVPEGTNLKTMLQIVRTKFKKKPVFLDSPEGNRTRFIAK
jgi:hypothetical protein